MIPIVHSDIDRRRRLATVTTRFAHPIDAVWTLWADPARLSLWWGPPGMPMTVHRHDLRAGGSVEHTVDTPHGPIHSQWLIHAVEPPRHVRFTLSSDGLEPTKITVRIAATTAATTDMHLTARFPTDEQFQHAIRIGFVEGLRRSCTAAHAAIIRPT